MSPRPFRPAAQCVCLNQNVFIVGSMRVVRGGLVLRGYSWQLDVGF